MSALPPKADIAERDRHVRFVPKADIPPTFSLGDSDATLVMSWFRCAWCCTSNGCRACHSEVTAMREAVIVALACFLILIMALALIVQFVPQ